jgi:hypothetical protein
MSALYEEMLEGQGEPRKLRPCVVIGVVREAGQNARYFLYPMAGFYEEGWRLLAVIQDLEEPA